jgi:hypothetical protein
VIYQARDMAVLRAPKFRSCWSTHHRWRQIVNVARGRYQRVVLPRRRPSCLVRLVDMRRDGSSRAFSIATGVAELAATFQRRAGPFCS